jgi:NAD(P)-dependent dehydrogenase (short-subunit alcohol dehydrogenase family)
VVTAAVRARGGPWAGRRCLAWRSRREPGPCPGPASGARRLGRGAAGRAEDLKERRLEARAARHAQLPEGREGLIVNLLDQRVWRLNPHFFSYTLTKSALWTATQTMAQAFAPRIRVNGVGPGPTLANHMQRAEDFRREAESIPLQRAITPDEIVAAVLFLLEARSVTGQMIAVDGGQHLAWKTPDVLD